MLVRYLIYFDSLYTLVFLNSRNLLDLTSLCIWISSKAILSSCDWYGFHATHLVPNNDVETKFLS